MVINFAQICTPFAIKFRNTIKSTLLIFFNQIIQVFKRRLHNQNNLNIEELFKSVARSKNCQNEIYPLNQKSLRRFFENMEDYHPYLLGISSKIVGKEGKMGFFGLEVFNLWRSVLTRKSWRIKKFLFQKLNTSLWPTDPQ